MLLLLAAAFAVVNGANDGGAMVAAQLRVPRVPPLMVIVTMVVALAAVPLLAGTGVADTLMSGLVRAPQGRTPTVIAIGVAAAIVVVALLTRAGLPTSLTLGMVGGIIGAGVGLGLPVIAGGVVRVVLIGIAAPIVGGVLAQLLTNVSAGAIARGGSRGLAALGGLATVAQAIAYAANDGQKMIAVVAVTSVGVVPLTVIGIALLFAVGATVGMRAAAGTLSGAIVRVGPAEEVTAQLGGAAAVISSAALGVPVSMTQSITGGLVGTGMLRGVRRVRWRVAGQLAIAWVITLPSSAAAGAVGAWIVRGV
jgi:PiT family inorganic phosphate transporter